MKIIATLLYRTSIAAMFVFALAVSASAQNPKLNLDGLSKLEARAAKSVDITLHQDMLTTAAKLLGSSDDPDSKRVKELIGGINEIAVRSYEFDKPGEYSLADAEAIRSQLSGGGWSRLVNIKSRTDGDNAEVYVMQQGDKVLGLAILVAEPEELTVVNIVGSIDVSRLSELDGEFGIPRIELKRATKPATH